MTQVGHRGVAFALTFCPRYIGDSSQSQIFENHISQRTLWNAVQFILSRSEQNQAEIRFSASVDRRITISIHYSPGIRINELKELSEEYVELGRVLPSEYGWNLIRDIDKSTPSTTPLSMTMCGIERRIEFVDLPSILPWLAEQSVIEQSQRQSSSVTAPPSATDASQEGLTQFLDVLFDGYTFRTMPKKGYPLRSLMGRIICIPVLGDIKDEYPDRRRFFEELQYAAPASVSIQLRPVVRDELKIDRILATQIRDCAETVNYALATSGFGRLKELRQAYDRYWLPHNFLCSSQVAISATSVSKVIALAHHFCSRLGGMRAFELVPRETNEMATIAQGIGSSPNSIWARAFVPEEIGRVSFASRLKERFAQNAIDDDPDYYEFLRRMSTLYTLEEAESLVRLPFAGQEGLPGMEARSIPPFFMPAMTFRPVLDSTGTPSNPPDDQIRVGVVQLPTSFTLATGAVEGDGFAQSLSNAQWHTMPVSNLCKHTFIVGSTGSGKTKMTLFLCKELSRLKIPFLIIEPVKSEYYDLLKPHIPSLKRWHFEGTRKDTGDDSYLRFDPLRLQPNVTVSRHVSYLKSCFEAAFAMEQSIAQTLENGLFNYYGAPVEKGGCGLPLPFGTVSQLQSPVRQNKVYPSLATFMDYFLNTSLREQFATTTDVNHAEFGKYFAEVYTWFKRRFTNLQIGAFGHACKLANEAAVEDVDQLDCFRNLIATPTVIELDAVADGEQRSLIMSFLMSFLFERRQADDLFNGKWPNNSLPKHVMILEEAHRILSNSESSGLSGKAAERSGVDAKAKAAAMFAEMLAEIRAFGQGMIIVEQIPTKIIPDAIKNTNLKIMFRLTAKDDRDYLGEAMGFTEDQKRFVTNLKTGQFVAFDEQHDQPLQLQLPFKHSPGWLFDEFFRNVKGD